MNFYDPSQSPDSGHTAAVLEFPTHDQSLNNAASSTETTWTPSEKAFLETFFSRTGWAPYLEQYLPYITVTTHPYDCPPASCNEKAAALEWENERIIKALYYRTPDGQIVIIAAPDKGNVRTRPVKRALGIKNLEPIPEDELPWERTYGNCAVFIDPRAPEDVVFFFDEVSVRESLARLGEPDANDDFTMIFNHPEVPDMLISVQMPYGIAYQLLATVFGERVKLVYLLPVSEA